MAFHQTTLGNGLTIIADFDPAALSVAMGFFIKTGSRDESSELAGVSHFLEHMIFKGTEKRNALEVNQGFDRIGAMHNAQTSEEETVYYAACLPENLEPALDILADILRPSLRESDFETEKQVILEEIAMYQDNPMMVAYERAKALHFGDHPLGQSVLGTPESITALSRDQMAEYFATRYAPGNTTLVVTGNLDWNLLVDLAERLCGHWPVAESPRTTQRPKGQTSFEALKRDQDRQITVVGVSDAPAVEDDDRYAAMLVATILGDPVGSRLYWELIETGLADSADISYQEYNQAGSFLTFLSCGPDRAQANLDATHRLFAKTVAEGFRPEEMEQARNKVAAREVLRHERPMGRLMPLGMTWTYRRRPFVLQEELDQLSKVTLADLQAIQQQYPLSAQTLVTIGPEINLQAPERT